MTEVDDERSLTLPGADAGQIALAAYNQNFETFRALNALMWQIPLIAMTLTGGLWFGVSKVEKMPAFQLGLLGLALFGNIGLIIILERLRHIMGRYLDWLRDAYPAGHVSALGAGRLTRNRTVKVVFQAMLGLAAAISLVLWCTTVATLLKEEPAAPSPATAWYDAHAEQLADGYESLDAADVHRELFAVLGEAPLRILDVGAGTGRDAAALAALGHRVTAVEPSSSMLRLARSLHGESKIDWVADALPRLANVSGRFDLVVLSAVWMHVPPAERTTALRRLLQLTGPGGRIYVTLRVGPGDPARNMYEVSAEGFIDLARREGLRTMDLGRREDLLGREGVSWRSVLLHR